ncbi:MAG: methionyl-tRNA formyltransferase [Proteobacteria bacterium]|nr:methionyl-tRNA formyltransferase [Pseudomonadota bacterium]
MPRLDLAFMGSPDFAVPVLAALLREGHRVRAAYTQPPRPAGRGQRTTPSPVQAFAEDHGVPVHTPESLKERAPQDAFAALGLDACVVAAYGLILPGPVLAAPRLGCLNVHASLLPRWRGAAPVERAILAGDRETGVTIMLMDEGLDTGPILLSEATPISGETTAAGLIGALAQMGAGLAVRALEGLAAGTLDPRPQPVLGVTHAPRIEKPEGRIDWSRPADELERKVRALNPRPGVWFGHAGRRVKVLAARVVDGDGAPGAVLDDRMTIACGSGALRPLRLQRAGRKPQAAEEFLRGAPLAPGTVLS